MSRKIFFFSFLFTVYLIYSGWVYTSGTETSSDLGSMSRDAHAGKILYQEYNCIACHQLFGLGGYLGPELTHVISQPGKGPLFVGALLQIGVRQMPVFQLDSTQIKNIVAYLTYVDSSATIERIRQDSNTKNYSNSNLQTNSTSTRL